MKWRIYRLPGSRQIWHVDRGPETQIINVLGFEIHVPASSIDIGDGIPRAWIEIPFEGTELHVMNGVAIWTPAAVAVPVAEPVSLAQLPVRIRCAEDAQQD